MNLILFVHGLGGDATTWGQFPHLLNMDPDLRDTWRAELFSFPTKILSLPFSSNTPRLQMLADGLRDTITYRYKDAANIVLACHSLGGLVARRYLLDQFKRGLESPVRTLLLFATPNDGAGLAAVARMFNFWNFQIRQLCRNSDVIDDLDLDWRQADIDGKISVTCFVGSADKVVSESSARGHWLPEQVKVILGADHRSIVKPASRDTMQYLILKSILQSRVAARRKPQELELRIDGGGNILGDRNALALDLDEYIHLHNRELRVAVEPVEKLKKEFRALDTGRALSARDRRLKIEIQREIDRYKRFDVDLEDLLTSVTETTIREFGPVGDGHMVDDAEAMLEVLAGLFPVFVDKNLTQDGLEFDVLPTDRSWSHKFAMPNMDVARLTERYGVPPHQLKVTRGLTVDNLSRTTIRTRVIPAIVHQLVSNNYVAQRSPLSDFKSPDYWSTFPIGLH